MASVKLTRRPENGRICLQFCNAAKQSRYQLPISVEEKQWDKEACKIINHPQKVSLNITISGILNAAQKELANIQLNEPTKNMPTTVLRDKVCEKIFNTENLPSKTSFMSTMDKFIASHTNARTREIYMSTQARIRAYDNRDFEFRDVTIQWLDGFVASLAQTEGVNARAIHLRNIRAVFNYALKYDITEYYPFRRYQIKTEETPYRDMTKEELLRLWSYQPPTERTNKHASKPLDWAVKYIDTSRIIFYLMGINVVDLCRLTTDNIHNGRIRYQRAKTGRWYDIKLEPEAVELLKKYKGTTKLWAPCETYANYKDFAQHLNNAIKKISTDMGIEPATTYSIRYAYASIGYKIGLPMDTISDLLGHKLGNRVTIGYVNKRRVLDNIDAAHRSILDYIKEETPHHHGGA